nr:transposase [Psychromonas hadalis]
MYVKADGGRLQGKDVQLYISSEFGIQYKLYVKADGGRLQGKDVQLYISSELAIPFAFKLITKDIQYSEIATKKLKSNRLIALSKEDKLQGCFQRIDSLDWSDTPWVKGIDIPVVLHRQTFKNKDGSEGIYYLMSNDVELDKDAIETIYQKRWKVEVLHKNIKSNTALAKSPVKTIKTQSNPIFMSLLATVKLECLSIKKGLTTFSLKMKLYIKAQKVAIEALHLEQASTA